MSSFYFSLLENDVEGRGDRIVKGKNTTAPKSASHWLGLLCPLLNA